MAYAKLSLSQAASINLARLHADDDTRKLVKKDIFAAAKQAYGIPVTTKLKCETTDDTSVDYLVLRDSRAGTAFPLDPHTGLWIGSIPAAPVAMKWFRVAAADVRSALIEFLEGQCADVLDSFDAPPSETPTDDDGSTHGVAMDCDGDVYIRINADRFNN